ncbi:MAG: hypothetical protein Q9162_002120 [Coniocarpon cinnabarinum]
MLGRLRMDLEKCKSVYVRMTKRVFETDKTFAGIPFKSTLFKASKLEEAIRECVREFTVFDDEGNDNLAMAQDLTSPATPNSPNSAFYGDLNRSGSTTSRPLSVGSGIRGPMSAGRFGNPNALLYDVREKRTKTAITAVYKNAPRHSPPALLRSYDSRREAPPEFNCTIWQAGRATSAIGLAFKPIQIGQSVFIDEGQGKFNPSPVALDEATLNEYPGRDVGVFVSIGTGKRPGGTDAQSHQWWESFVGGTAGEFAEARRRLMAKIEGCEETHQSMLREHLTKRGVNVENYYRLNVEVGVGEFGMNEWNRLSDISTSSRMYLGKPDIQQQTQSASAKMARIHNAKVRWQRSLHAGDSISSDRDSWQESVFETSKPIPPPSNPMAVELPADEGFSETRPASQSQSSPRNSPPAQGGAPYKPPFPYQRAPSGGGDKLAVSAEPPPRVSDEFPTAISSDPRRYPAPSSSPERYPQPPSTQQDIYGRTQYYEPPPVSAMSPYTAALSPNGQVSAINTQPPPLPPKTPFQNQNGPTYYSSKPPLPYPDDDLPPPPRVDMSKKPQSGVR